jgi:hypothetical protein
MDRAEWVSWMTHEDPRVPWMPRELKAKVDDFELVLKSRFPSVQDVRTAPWGRSSAACWHVVAGMRATSQIPGLLRTVRRLGAACA